MYKLQPERIMNERMSINEIVVAAMKTIVERFTEP